MNIKKIIIYTYYIYIYIYVFVRVCVFIYLHISSLAILNSDESMARVSSLIIIN